MTTIQNNSLLPTFDIPNQFAELAPFIPVRCKDELLTAEVSEKQKYGPPDLWVATCVET